MSICVHRLTASSQPSMTRRIGRFVTLGVAALVVAALVQPGAASASNIGAGVASGNVVFDAGKEIPRGINPNSPTTNEPCAPTSFTLSGSTLGTAAFVLNSAFTGHFGTVEISGVGGSTCETGLGGGGILTLTNVHGQGPTGSKIECANPTKGTTLTGGYTRTATDVEAVLGGTCIINGPPGFSAPVLFSFRGQFEPKAGTGLTTPTAEATFQGVFAIEPA